MNVMTMSTRLAATGSAAALAAAALVGMTTTAAQADPVVNNTYACTASGQTFPVALTTNAPGIENFVDFGLKAGTPLPGDALTVTNTFTISDGVHAALVDIFNVAKIDAPDFTGNFGGNPVGVAGVSVTMAGFTQNDDESWSSDPSEGDGLNLPFTTPAAGAQDVLSPAALNLVATTESGAEIPVSCTIAEGTTPGSYSTINILKNDSTVVGKATKKKFTKGKAAKVVATVTGVELEGDKVLLKKGSKTFDKAVLNDAGKATLSTKKLPVGKNKLTVVYKATGYNTGSKSAPVVVKIVR